MQLLYTLTIYPPAIGGAQLHQHLLAQQLQQQQIQIFIHWAQNRTDWLIGTTVKTHILQNPKLLSFHGSIDLTILSKMGFNDFSTFADTVTP